MTECERLIAEGKFSREWFKPEVRCDFLVDENRKKVWAILLDLLEQFGLVCEKHGLRWFSDGGTTIGAIRHRGIIPWDDDVDVVMPRRDYEKFIKLGKEFHKPYFLKVPGANGYFCSFAKLCNSNTSAICESVKYCPYNQGIFLDVLPLDDVKVQDNVKDVGEIDRLNRANGLIMRMTHPNPSDIDVQRYAGLTDRDGVINLGRINDLARRFDGEDCDSIACLVFTGTPYLKHVWKKEWFSDFKLMPFEGFNVRVPIDYDSVLKTTFCDYMVFPPVSERGLRHSCFFFDADKPYTHYIPDTN